MKLPSSTSGLISQKNPDRTFNIIQLKFQPKFRCPKKGELQQILWASKLQEIVVVVKLGTSAIK
jgi:hypothetical protein